MVSQQQDPHQGGSLSEMAPSGTAVPNDAGKMRTVPSVPRPDQRAEHFEFDNEGVAEPTTAAAVDNAVDMPRSTRDVGATGEVVTGTGNTMPAQAEYKRQMGTNLPGGHGEVREYKHMKDNRDTFDRKATEQGGPWKTGPE